LNALIGDTVQRNIGGSAADARAEAREIVTPASKLGSRESSRPSSPVVFHPPTRSRVGSAGSSGGSSLQTGGSSRASSRPNSAKNLDQSLMGDISRYTSLSNSDLPLAPPLAPLQGVLKKDKASKPILGRSLPAHADVLAPKSVLGDIVEPGTQTVELSKFKSSKQERASSSPLSEQSPSKAKARAQFSVAEASTSHRASSQPNPALKNPLNSLPDDNRHLQPVDNSAAGLLTNSLTNSWAPKGDIPLAPHPLSSDSTSNLDLATDRPVSSNARPSLHPLYRDNGIEARRNALEQRRKAAKESNAPSRKFAYRSNAGRARRDSGEIDISKIDLSKTAPSGAFQAVAAMMNSPSEIQIDDFESQAEEFSFEHQTNNWMATSMRPSESGASLKDKYGRMFSLQDTQVSNDSLQDARPEGILSAEDFDGDDGAGIGTTDTGSSSGGMVSSIPTGLLKSPNSLLAETPRRHLTSDRSITPITEEESFSKKKVRPNSAGTRRQRKRTAMTNLEGDAAAAVQGARQAVRELKPEESAYLRKHFPSGFVQVSQKNGVSFLQLSAPQLQRNQHGAAQLPTLPKRRAHVTVSRR
jgi:hypothetical protein